MKPVMHFNLTAFGRFSLLSFICILACLGCKKDPNAPKASDHTILAPNFLATSLKRFENTCKAIPPGSDTDCPNGVMVLLTGQSRPGEIVTRDLYDGAGNIYVGSTFSSQGYPFDTTLEKMATDNQIVRLKNGNLLAVKNGYTWQDNVSHKAWWDAFDNNPNWPSGSRNSIYIWYSSNCGKTWPRITRIDPAKQFDGKYAWPQPSDKKDRLGNTIYGIGGYDRTEAYACPFTGTIYISAHGDGGPFPVGSTTYSYHNLVIFYSTNNGSSWEEMGEISDGAPLVMTSTPNGRFYAFSASGAKPKLYYTKVPGNPSTLIGPYETWYNESPGDPSKKAIPAIDKEVQILRSIQQIAISRISLDKNSSQVRIAYPALNGFGRQEYKVLSARVDDEDPASGPTVNWSRTFKPADLQSGSLVYGAFIDPDFVDMPSGTQFNKSLFYCIESSTNGSPFSNFTAKYSLVYNALNFATDLTGLSNWTTAVTPGDYFTGGFFWKDGKAHYVPQWLEPDGIHAAVIRAD